MNRAFSACLRLAPNSSGVARGLKLHSAFSAKQTAAMLGKTLADTRSRCNSEVTEQLTDLLSHFFAMHDHVDQTMFLEKFSGLKSFRQFLMSSFFDHTRPGETDHAFGFSNNHVA